MAFGDKAKTIKDKEQSASTGADGEKKSFDSQWMPAGSGTRYFRPLQEVKDGKLVLAERKTASGKTIFEGGKKTGKPMLGPVPAEEVVFMFAWWTVNVGGEQKPKRLMLDPYAGGDINTSKFKNPLWKFIQDNYAKGARERNAIKLAFALNVWDVSPVMRNGEGTLFYQAEDDTWRLQAFGNNGKLIDPKDKFAKLPDHYKMDLEDALEGGHAELLRKIRILEGSYGKPASQGGKHLFAQFEQLAATFEDNDGIIRRLGEFDLRMTTTGEGIDTVRAIRPLNRFGLLPDEANFGTRYDLETWTRPWPDEVIERLIDGEDYNDLVTEFELVQFPALFDNEEAYTGKTEKLDPASVGLAKADEEDGLFEE